MIPTRAAISGQADLTAQTHKEPIGFIGPLAGTFAVQTIVSLAMFGIPVIAPVAARDIGVDAELVGTFTAIAYATGMFAGLLSGIAASHIGLIRVCQSTMVLVLAGALVLALSSPVAAIASAVLLGLSYGPINPVSTQILASVTTPRARPLVFSVKQTGMPAGAALAGVLLPFMIGSLRLADRLHQRRRCSDRHRAFDRGPQIAIGQA